MRVLERAGVAELLDHGGDGRALLADGHIDADDAGALLIDDRVHRDGRLAGAAVADDQLALTAADRDHRVDGLDPGLQRLLHRLAHDDARRHHLDLAGRARLDRAAAVHRPAQGVDHPAEHRGAGRHLEQTAGATDFVALLELEVVAHDRGAHVVLFQVEHQPRHRVAGLRRGELEHLARDSRLETVNPGDAVPHLENGADLGDVAGGEIGGGDLTKQNVLQFAGTEGGIGGHVVGSLA